MGNVVDLERYRRRKQSDWTFSEIPTLKIPPNSYQKLANRFPPVPFVSARTNAEKIGAERLKRALKRQTIDFTNAIDRFTRNWGDEDPDDDGPKSA